jgi:putative nucleotidyltransferase with HDIG domain
MTPAAPPPAAATAVARRDPNVLISAVAAAASAALILSWGSTLEAARGEPLALAAFVALTMALQAGSIEVYNRGTTSFGSAGVLAVGFGFGAGPAMATAVLMGVTTLVLRHGRVNRGVFDAAQFALAAGAGAALYGVLESAGLPVPLAALGAGGAYMLVNVGLLCVAIGLADGTPFPEVWRERFRWLTPYYLAAGPLAYALTLAYERLGMTGLAAFALPPAMMMLSVRQYVARTKQGVEEVRRANEELRTANAELATKNADLHALFQFAGGLASRASDREELVTYAELALGRLIGAPVTVAPADSDRGTELVAGGSVVGRLDLDEEPGLDEHRWERLRDAILPQLATAIESADLVERVRKTHLATIAALSKSMEAKDYYTGGHTERVATLAVALARRLGYSGEELDAIEVGALLHDIGKIGIPEHILQKPGPLDESEWEMMKKHPVISEYILSEVGLHPIVLQVARSSHERIDGKGYPDGRRGDEIPLPARIVLVADALDALTSDRPYRRGRSVAEALDEIRANSGTQFCPVVVEAIERINAEERTVLGAPQLHAVSAA